MQIHFTSTICTFAWCTALRVSHHLHTSRLHNCSSFSNDVKMDKSLSFRDRQVSNAFRLPLDLTYVSHRVALCNSHVIWPIIITAHIATHSARKPAFSLSRKKNKSNQCRKAEHIGRSFAKHEPIGRSQTRINCYFHWQSLPSNK